MAASTVTVPLFLGQYPVAGVPLAEVDQIHLRLSFTVQSRVRLETLPVQGPILDCTLIQDEVRLGLIFSGVSLNNFLPPAVLEPSERPYIFDYNLRLATGSSLFLSNLSGSRLEVRLWENFPLSWLNLTDSRASLEEEPSKPQIGGRGHLWMPALTCAAVVLTGYIIKRWYFNSSTSGTGSQS